MGYLYCIFHLNLAYSSIEEEQRPDVIRRCYWPLLRLAHEYDLPFGIEATGYTLETVAAIDPKWLSELRWLTSEGHCEFIGSGYAQIIGPLVPAEVNGANLKLGHEVYDRLLGFRPRIALANEQAYSSGLVRHYLDAGYRAIVMEWNNPAHYHPEWDPEWRFLPQFACGQDDEEIPLIWNDVIAFQKFQRYAHGEMELAEYLDYLLSHLAEKPRVLPLYGNDVEIFDFRPGRYETEADLQEDGEWRRVSQLFEVLSNDGRFQLVRPRQVLELMQMSGAGRRLHLESAEQPIPVKKQGKYNITRWAVTGRDDLGINTACWRIYETLKANPKTSDNDWRELCYLWNSDFRTHITEKRWIEYRERLAAFEEKIRSAKAVNRRVIPCGLLDINHSKIKDDGRYLTVETDAVKVCLDCRRGLVVDGLWFKDISDLPLVGTLHHGYYDNISLGADYYTGHLIFESAGQPKVTDLNPADFKVENNKAWTGISGIVHTPFGPIRKRIRILADMPRVELEYFLAWEAVPLGSLRLGHITLNPEAFESETLFYSTHNGGYSPETFLLDEGDVNHGNAFSFLVSASQGIGITEGAVELGDAKTRLRMEVDKSAAALIGFITYRRVNNTYFFRLAFSALEMDETSRLNGGKAQSFQLSARLSLAPVCV